MSISKKTKKAARKALAPRSTSRLAAVQALYQMDVAQTALDDIIEEFSTHRLGQEVDGSIYKNADQTFFIALLRGVVEKQREIDPLLDQQLASGWRLTRIDSILRAILRSAAFELLHMDHIPPNVIISEYLDIAHAFFEKDEPKVVNGVLDNFAKKNPRAGEKTTPPQSEVSDAGIKTEPDEEAGENTPAE